MFIYVGSNCIPMHLKIKRIKGHCYLYLIENQRVDGKVKQVRQVCVGNADKVQALLEGPKDLKVASFSFGKPAALLLAAQELGLMESLDARLGRKQMRGLRPSEYLMLALIGRAERAQSRSALAAYFQRSALQFVLEPEHSLQAQNFLNYMERLDEEVIERVEADVSASLKAKGYRPSALIFDTTNFYTYVEEGYACKGCSKDKRYDRNLVGVGLTISREALPFQSFAYEANMHDSRVFSEAIDGITRRLRELDAEEVLMIIDRGMLSADNLDRMQGMRFLSSLPYPLAREFHSLPLEAYEETWQRGEDTLRAHRASGAFYGREVTVVIKHNPATERRQRHEWERSKARILEKVQELRSSLAREGRGRRITAKGLINRLVDAIPRQHRGLFRYKALEVEGELRLDFALDEEAERALLGSLGKTVLITDDAGMSTREIVEAYVARNEAEEGFKYLKGRLIMPLKPMYVRTEGSVRAHVFLCVLGLLLYNFLLLRLREKGIVLSLPALAGLLEDVRLSLVCDGLRKPRFVIEDMDAKAFAVFEALDLKRLMPSA